MRSNNTSDTTVQIEVFNILNGYENIDHICLKT